MRLLFLNQYFPPDPAPTGVLLKELADELQHAGHEVDFVAARQDYRGGQRRGGRMRREMIALGRMLWDGVRRPKAEVVISATSPPCLLVVAMLVAGWHRARSLHWVMDLYPDIAVALGEIRGGFAARMIGRLMDFCYRRTGEVVVLDDDMAARLRRSGVEPAVVRPWVFESVLAQLAAVRAEAAEPWTWIYSGNLGRAHEWATLLDAQAEIEARGSAIRLVFQGGGPSWPAAQARAREMGLRQVEWRDYVDEGALPASLLRCHVLAVTQRPEVRGLLWPSKLGLVMSLPRPVVWIGPTDGVIAAELRTLPHAGIFAPGQGREVAEWVLARQAAEQAVPSGATIDPAAHRREALAALTGLLSRR
jgi:hypothetical protein